MTEQTDKHRQQVLFDEPNIIQLESGVTAKEQQIVISNDKWQALDNDNELVELTPVIAPPSKKRSWLWPLGLGAFATLIVAETISFFQTGFAESPVITALYASVLVIATILASSACWREWRGLRQFKRQQRTQHTVTQLLQNKANIDVEQFTQTISQSLAVDIDSSTQNRWQEVLQSELSDAEKMQLYSRIVLEKSDERALREVAKFSTEAVALVTISPMALLDMVLLLWRNLRMIDQLSAIYGIRLGYWSRIKLIKQVLVNLVYAGASELLADVGVEMFGADLVGKVSARLAQGFGAGMLTARLGLKVIKLCRPVPFIQHEPVLKDIRREVIGQVKRLINKEKKLK